MEKHIIRHVIRPHPKIRLFCFPYAGSSAAIYRIWNQDFPDSVEICAVELPGRAHMREAPANSILEVRDIIYPDLQKYLDLPYIFFGHSFGSVVAYEMAKLLQIEKKPLPQHLWISSRRAPHLPPLQPLTYELDDEQFLTVVQQQYGAIPQAVLIEKELLKLLLPILKADIKLNELYRGDLNPILTIPLTILYGNEDYSISREELEKWREVTNAATDMQAFIGGHFFIDTERSSVARKILDKMQF